MLKYYQNLKILNDSDKEHENRLNSQYWNEGKWNNYIKPLLPQNCSDMTLLDIGCNAGLFLKLAKDHGFRHAIGIEKDKGSYERGLRYRRKIGYDYDIYNKAVGDDFDIYDMPVVDVALIINVHYYIDLNEWLKFLDKLINKTCYCIIITRPVRTRHHWRPKTKIGGVKWYFRDWKPAGAIYRSRYGKRNKKDPSPRLLWAMRFESRLKRIKFKDLHIGAPGDMIKFQRKELVEKVLEKNDLDVRKTEYYKAWRKRMKKKWSEEKTYEFVKKKVDLMFDIKKNGIKDPILVQMDNKVIDGGHRIAIAKELGYKSIITRPI